MGRKKRGSRRSSGKKRSAKEASKRMLVNVVDPEEVRVALLGERGLEELYIERTGGEYSYGNIYKGKVQNIEPSLQAAFVDIGGEKNGFLHASDVVAPHGGYDDILKRRRRKKPADTHRMPIQDMLYKGQEVLVQITRESVSSKGPSLTTYISLPGRYLVLMPAVSNKRGVSRKIRDDEERHELKKALDELDPPTDMGYIIRTAGMGRGKEQLRGDLDYLLRLWEAIAYRARKVKAPCAIYRESDLVIRAIRDYLNDDVDELLIDREEEWMRAREFLKVVMPGFEEHAHLYEEVDPMFDKFDVEDAIEKIFSRSVPLPSGGGIVIEQTEALVAIDVNTGRFKGENSQEMILTINSEAAVEIARQLRLRDMGGLIMIDFIDMDTAADRRKVEDLFRSEVCKDRARTTILPISQFGVMEMTRQRMRQSLRGALFRMCPCCGGSGLTKSPDMFALEFVRRLRSKFIGKKDDIEVRMHPDSALLVGNLKRAAIGSLEQEYGAKVHIVGDSGMKLDEMEFISGDAAQNG